MLEVQIGDVGFVGAGYRGMVLTLEFNGTFDREFDVLSCC